MSKTRRTIERLNRTHPLDGFDCGEDALNRFLLRFALANQQANAAQTYVASHDAKIIGFYTLAVGEVSHQEATERVKKGMARHPIPVMLLARLAVDTRWHGRGVGSGLLKDAMLRTLKAADIAGIRALVVHAKDDNAKSFYERYDFTPSPTDPKHLFLLLKDLRGMT